MAQHDFIQQLHNSTKRDYVARVVEYDKGDCATVACQFGKDYWDGDRQYGYGGYKYDGRWKPIAEKIIAHFDIKDGMKILDVGCGKGYLLHEFKQLLPNLEIAGLDVSDYAIENAKPEVKSFLKTGCASTLPYADNSFDAVVSLGTLHNLHIDKLFAAIKEIERVCKTNKSYIMIESYRNQKEKANLLYWQLTCEAFFTPEEWQWIFEQNGYTGDFGCIYFE